MLQLPANKASIVIVVNANGEEMKFAYEGYNWAEEGIRWLSKGSIQPSHIARNDSKLWRAGKTFGKGTFEVVKALTGGSTEDIHRRKMEKRREERELKKNE